jgi:hypothetical protein
MSGIWNPNARGGRLPIPPRVVLTNKQRAHLRVNFITDVLYGIEHQTELPPGMVTSYAQRHRVAEEVLGRMADMVKASQIREVQHKST